MAGQAFASQISLLWSHSPPRGTLTSCQDLYFPRVSSQGPLVCPPECHASCQAKRRVIPTATPPQLKRRLTSLVPTPLLLNGQRPQEGSFLHGFLSQESHEIIREERKAEGNYGIPVAATRIPP